MSDSPVTIIVDDQDARINYDSKWTSAGSSADFRGTVHASNDTSASLTFRFNGTSISLVGVMEPGASCSARFIVDGETSSFTFPAVQNAQHQRILFTKGELDQGSHTFVYGVGDCEREDDSTSGPFMAVDQLLYTSTNADLDGTTFFIDDRDPQLEYSGEWEQTTAPNSFMETATGGSVGSSLFYSFSGTRIEVYGLLSDRGAVEVDISLDGQAPETHVTPVQNLSNYEYFVSKRLEMGLHTLEITPKSDEPFWLDYILVDPASTSSTVPPSPASSGPNLPAIIGGSLAGGVVLITALAALWFVLQKRKGKPLKRYSGASSARFFRKNEGFGVYAQSTAGASHWSGKNADSVVSTTAGHLVESRVSRAPPLPTSRPVLYDSVDNSLSPGPSSSGSRTEGATEEGFLVNRQPNNGVYPPTPPYMAVNFDSGSTRAESPASRATAGMYTSMPPSPTHTTTTFDRSMDHSVVSHDLTRSPPYRTTTPGSGPPRATSPVSALSHGQQPPLESITERERRASITPSYITTVPVSSTLEISEFLPPRVVEARQNALGPRAHSLSESRPPPSAFANTGRNNPTTHGRAPSYATTASSAYPPSPPTLPPSIPVSVPSKDANIPHTFHATPPSLPRISELPSRSASPRAGHPLPTPPSPSGVSATSNIRGGLAPSTISLGYEAHSIAVTGSPPAGSTPTATNATNPSFMTLADMKRLEAEQESQEPRGAGGGAEVGNASNAGLNPSGSATEEPPPQYTYRF